MRLGSLVAALAVLAEVSQARLSPSLEQALAQRVYRRALLEAPDLARRRHRLQRRGGGNAAGLPQNKGVEAFKNAQAGRPSASGDANVMDIPYESETGKHAAEASAKGHNLGDGRPKAEQPNRPEVMKSPQGKEAQAAKQPGQTVDEKPMSSDAKRPGQPETSVKNVPTAEQNVEGGHKSKTNAAANPDKGGTGKTAIRVPGMP